MNIFMRIRSFVCTAAVLLICCMVETHFAAAQNSGAETYYYGIEINDVLCGYAEVQIATEEREQQEVLTIREKVFAMMSALGSSFNTRQSITYDIDPVSGNFFRHTNTVDQGDQHFGGEYIVEGDEVVLKAIGEAAPRRIALTENAILPNTMYFPYLQRDFAGTDRESADYTVLQVRDGALQKVTCTRLPDEDITMGDIVYHTVGVEEFNQETGMKIRFWIDKETAQLLRAEFANRRVFRTDEAVVKRIQAADLDDGILIKANKSIADIQGITSMTVHAKLKPFGVLLTEEGLNGPGQKFEGTVRENEVDGEFHISHVRYDGKNAPVFPCDFSADRDFQKYLSSSPFCESDDPVLIETAREIAAGSKTSWEAARRLSRWVAENISYAIPGGGSAKKTLEIRAGECGAHSLLLAAFCRGVGIPARVVWGCMYTPNLGGSFGQHAWNEIYMGEAGWIPVDATAMEVDFVDSGHLRVGEMQSTAIALNPEEMNILDYRLGTGSVAPERTSYLAPYLGMYTSEAIGNKLFEVLEQNGKLAVHIPDKMTLTFHDPDENGIWPCQLAPKLTLQFTSDTDEEITAMVLMEENRMPRVEAEIEIPDDIPDPLRPMVGTYELKALKANFQILFDEGQLTLKEPRGALYSLSENKNADYYEAKDGSRRVAFERDAGGTVVAIITTHCTVLEKQ